MILGIDLGTQSVKVVVCDDTLTVKGDYQVGHDVSHPKPGWAEQDPRIWIAGLARGISRALSAAGVSGDQIRAIAIAGQLDGCIAVDDRGQPLHPALIWQDKRAVDHLPVDPKRLFELTGQVADASHLAAKAAWLRAHDIHATAYHQPTSFLVEYLTGERVLDHAHASTTMLYDLAAKQWSPELCAAFEIRETQLPRIADATAIAGKLRAQIGLPLGIPVAVGTGDDFSTPLGAGVSTPGHAICAIGTAEVVGALSTTPQFDPAAEPMVETHAYPTGAFFVENPGWLSGGAIRWATRLLGLQSDQELDQLATIRSSDGVVFIPALAGAMTPIWRANARGTLHGLAASHDRAHIARAVLEGLAFAARDVIDRLTSMSLPTTSVLLLGGGAKSTIWNQIRADVLQRPHHVAARSDSSAIGAAMIAATSIGIYPSLTDAAATAPQPVATFTPQQNLDDAYERYRVTVRQLAPMW
ncbi:MAG: FGGY family carbohydrate kinase [Kofleriaceae bacterium]